MASEPRSAEIQTVRDLTTFVGVVSKADFASTTRAGGNEGLDVRHSIVNRTQQVESRIVFRGQVNAAWEPLPKIDREMFSFHRRMRSKSRTQHELELLNQFKKAARPHLVIEPGDEWEWLAMAQHHGLATRLLDWTINPLIALFFALDRSQTETNATVWVYFHRGPTATDCPRPFETSDIVLCHPAHVSTRITAQGGCFTAHADGTISWPGSLRRITIPAACQAEMRRDLVGLGINRALLFPGLDGVADHLNWLLSTPPRVRSPEHL